MLRTKLVYNCYKNRDFDYVEKKYITEYHRCFDMMVTSDSKEECEKIMSSFEDIVYNVGIQKTFDSNLEPEFDNKKKLWIGVVAIDIGNDSVTEEKEVVKETYKEWKESLKNNTIVNPVASGAIRKITGKEILENKKLSDILLKSDCRVLEIKWLDGSITNGFGDDIYIEMVNGKISVTQGLWNKPILENMELIIDVGIEDLKLEKKIEIMIAGLDMKKEYQVEDTQFNFTVIKNEHGIWWGRGRIWNSFYSFKPEYQKYILDLIYTTEGLN